jgi:hypothetical protein
MLVLARITRELAVMGDAATAKWHIVIKTINGRRYRYRQKSWYDDGRVRTRTVYLEPADGYVSRRKAKEANASVAESPLRATET